MVNVNFATREVSCKIVYYGPGRSGKTTNLESIHAHAPTGSVGDIASIATESERTLFFDFLPLDLGSIAGMKTKFQLYTVPGQVYYNATRKIVLEGADGAVFVADSHPDVAEENIESLENLYENLRENNIDPDSIPLVFQWNKRDLDSAVPIEEMEAALNPRGLPSHEAVAVEGAGVFQTLKLLAAMVIKNLSNEYATDEARDVPEHAPLDGNAPPPLLDPISLPEPDEAAPEVELPDPDESASAPVPAFDGPDPHAGPVRAEASRPANALGANAAPAEQKRPEPVRRSDASRPKEKPQGVARRSFGASGLLRPFRGRLLAATFGALLVLGVQAASFWSGMLAGWKETLADVESGAWLHYLGMAGILLGTLLVCGLIGSLQDRRSRIRCFELGLAWMAATVIGMTVYRAWRPAPPVTGEEALPPALQLAETVLVPAAPTHRSRLRDVQQKATEEIESAAGELDKQNQTAQQRALTVQQKLEKKLEDMQDRIENLVGEKLKAEQAVLAARDESQRSAKLLAETEKQIAAKDHAVAELKKQIEMLRQDFRKMQIKLRDAEEANLPDEIEDAGEQP